jgi:cbb3-type cytochrome oxidase subunit 3
MRDADNRPPLEEDICIHIFTVSSGMVGVCLTAVGLLHVVTSIRKVATLADDIVTVDAVLFLVSALSAYWALRTRRRQRIYALEHFADGVFIAAMVLCVIAIIFITYWLNRELG